ncbi:MAG: FKBP-type peptidyl-prolyl cis-trans isomerase FkpA [Salibacteraceae bacterium]|jgi:FKBP-type peptidyl-prolyl cis-trans isomerase FkpA
MRFFQLFVGLVLLGVVSFGSCKKDEDPTDYTTIDKRIIQEYIAANNIDADSTASGLYYVIDKVGVGKTPSLYSDVKIRYKGYLTSGEVFDESNSGVRLNLSQVIAGWTEGVQKFKEGGEGLLLIPSNLGYGNTATGSIPANAVLIFEIKLDEVY